MGRDTSSLKLGLKLAAVNFDNLIEEDEATRRWIDNAIRGGYSSMGGTKESFGRKESDGLLLFDCNNLYGYQLFSPQKPLGGREGGGGEGPSSDICGLCFNFRQLLVVGELPYRKRLLRIFSDCLKMITIDQMKTIFDELVCREADKMLPWTKMDDALSRCGFKIKARELEFLSLKSDRLAFAQFHKTVKDGVTQRKEVTKTYAGKRLQTPDKWMASELPRSACGEKAKAAWIRDHPKHGVVADRVTNDTCA